MNGLNYAIEYMKLRVKYLNLVCEFDRFRNCNPTVNEARSSEAEKLLKQLQSFKTVGREG